MAMEYHALYANGRLSHGDFRLIKARLKKSEAVLRKVPAFADLPGVDVLIQAGSCSPCDPIRGCTSDFDRIISDFDEADTPDFYSFNITVDPCLAEYYRSPEKDNLSKTLAHKLYHILRMHHVGFEKTLGYALVSEGLAQRFELDTGHTASPYSMNLSKTELLEVSERARADILSGRRRYDHKDCFLGTEGNPLAPEPFTKWAGYSLGFAVVSSWLQNEKVNGGCGTAAEAVNVSADVILRPWLKEGNEFLKPWLETMHGVLPDRPVPHSGVQAACAPK